jgi:hypothetical protein
MGITLMGIGAVIILIAGLSATINILLGKPEDRTFRRHVVLVLVAQIGAGILFVGLVLFVINVVRKL